MAYGSSAQDPYLLSAFQTAVPFISTNGLTVRSATINPVLKTLVYIAAGQSNRTNNVPTTYIPSNATVIDNLNIYDGALYNIQGALLGSAWYPNTSTGVGNVLPRVADLFINSGMFNRVILVPIALPSTPAAAWSSGVLSNRVAVAMARLAARGITPSTTGVTFTFDWGLGETDGALGTTAPNFTSQTNAVFTAAIAAGYSGPFFVPTETWSSGTASPVIQGAQQAMWNGTTIFNGGNLDSLNNSNRSDTTNFNDTGSIAASILIFNAMSAQLGTWVTTASASLSVIANTFSGLNLRQEVDASNISTSGTLCRLTLMASSSSGAGVDSIYFGTASGTGPNFTGDQVQVFVGGSGSFIVAQNTSTVTDPFIFSLNEASNMMVACHFNGSAPGGLAGVEGNNSISGYTSSTKSGADESSSTTVTGYSSTGSRDRFLSKIEVVT